MTGPSGTQALCRLGDPDYPELLESIPDPPQALFHLGPMQRQVDALAIVGSRRPTPYGLRMARRIAGGAARAGLAVISGLARGIDAEAHRAALEAGGLTWAVQGCGLDRVYPRENAALAARIVESGGCVLSEFPPGTPPLASHFPGRNRIVAGLSWAVVVIEGRLHSGSLITARLAANQGREVMAVPGPADSDLSAAPHFLIGEGARLVRGIDDVLEGLPPGCGFRRCVPAPEQPARASGLAQGSVPGRKIEFDLPEQAGRLLDLIEPAGSTLEDLSQRTGLDFSQVSHIIFHLEISGLVEALEGQRYARI